MGSPDFFQLYVGPFERTDAGGTAAAADGTDDDGGGAFGWIFICSGLEARATAAGMDDFWDVARMNEMYTKHKEHTHACEITDKMTRRTHESK